LEQWAKTKVFLTGRHEIEAGCSVYLCGNSTATLCGNSTATLRDNSTATLWGNSTATLWDNSTATLCGNSTATLRDNSTATLCGNSTATLWGNSTATLWDNSTAKEIFGGVARFFCKFSVKISGKYSVAVDMTGDKAKCYVGTEKSRIIKGGK
jgi:hypothetical protein